MPSGPPSPRQSVARLDLTGDVPVVVVDAPVWLDLATAPVVEAVLVRALADRPPRLAVDLTSCAMADAFGLGMLARVGAAARADGTEVWLVGANRQVRRVVTLMGMDDALVVHAVEAVSAG
jgi:anti-anti-sigma factor